MSSTFTEVDVAAAILGLREQPAYQTSPTTSAISVTTGSVHSGSDLSPSAGSHFDSGNVSATRENFASMDLASDTTPSAASSLLSLLSVAGLDSGVLDSGEIGRASLDVMSQHLAELPDLVQQQHSPPSPPSSDVSADGRVAAASTTAAAAAAVTNVDSRDSESISKLLKAQAAKLAGSSGSSSSRPLRLTRKYSSRRPLPCTACRACKQKCDQTKPSCLSCERKGLECKYMPAHVENQEKVMASLEASEKLRRRQASDEAAARAAAAMRIDFLVD
ncbi:hypothetical protein CcCBS67573_g07907 [Chytriomyces confervae]|uniref:Zn(2)-C6 fungal-type domain-containing protein n=1 Tax=Chytriomyces confervae TaxID=246404 RepID=A0A507ESK7_9FUNG|nr:hypothetical protein CcCBS67573_g07907 [Chytriomyces confervae]